MQDLVYWIWLSLALTPGSDTFRKLLDKFDTAEAVYFASEQDIISCIGSRSRDFKSIKDKELTEALRIKDFCETKGVGILTYADNEFPQSLREIDTPPVLLYYRGKLPDFNTACMISMVGTRRLTDYGRKNAFRIGHDLAKVGAYIVSGMALGIDGVSHAGALSAGGINVAFLGSGIDVCYPPQHKRLAREIVKTGCVMTEYAPGSKPDKYNFPRRNRLIAGISAATVAIEGRETSGAIITARYAKKYGKTVYALPGNVDNKTSEVTNLLIKNGAKLITSADDIVRDFEFVYTGIINPFNLTDKIDFNMNDVFAEFEISCVCASDKIFSPPKSKGKKANGKKDKVEDESAQIEAQEAMASPEPTGFDKETLRIYKKIPADGECTVDSLADGNDKMPSVMKALLKLEMGGFVVMLPGEKVKRNL